MAKFKLKSETLQRATAPHSLGAQVQQQAQRDLQQRIATPANASQADTAVEDRLGESLPEDETPLELGVDDRPGETQLVPGVDYQSRAPGDGGGATMDPLFRKLIDRLIQERTGPPALIGGGGSGVGRAP